MSQCWLMDTVYLMTLLIHLANQQTEGTITTRIMKHHSGGDRVVLDEGTPSPRLSASTSSEVPSLTKGFLVVLCVLIGIGEWGGGGERGGDGLLRVICQRGGALLVVCLSLNALEFDPFFV